MDLFNTNRVQNILPFDGEAIDYGLQLNSENCHSYFIKFLVSDFWTQEQLFMFGK